MSQFSFSAMGRLRNSAVAAGINVTDRIRAPRSAVTTVKAMGTNIFPSTPLSAKMGI
jgi:hypothetical protein